MKGRFEGHRGRYGYRQINRGLRREGIFVSEKRVLKAMDGLGPQAKGATRKHRKARAVRRGTRASTSSTGRSMADTGRCCP